MHSSRRIMNTLRSAQTSRNRLPMLTENKNNKMKPIFKHVGYWKINSKKSKKKITRILRSVVPLRANLKSLKRIINNVKKMPVISMTRSARNLNNK